MTRYEHTQVSYLPHWTMLPILTIVLFAVAFGGATVLVWVIVGAYAVITAWLVTTFGALTVIVEERQLRLYFGRGWPRKAIPLDQVTSAQPVRNKWWYGIGIRWIPGGWLWNVWGLDAVELRLASGKVFRIGTDDVEGLVASLAL
jgi:hypothetical protein